MGVKQSKEENEIEIPKINFATYVLQKLRSHGNAIALESADPNLGKSGEGEVADGPSYTYSELVDHVHKLAGGLTAIGVHHGNVVCMLMPNCLQFSVVYLAVTLLGAVFQPLNPKYTKDELSRMFKECSTKFVFTNTEGKKKVQETGADVIVVNIDDEEDVETYQSLLEKGKSLTKAADVDPCTTTALYLSSSGTTGYPKAVQLSHYNVLACVLQMTRITPKMQIGDVSVLFVPLCHVFGLNCVLTAELLLGMKIVIMSKFDPARYLHLINKYQACLIHIVPPVALLLAKHPMVDNYDLRSVRYVICGAASLKPGVETALKFRLGVDYILQGFGMTEVGVSHANREGQYKLGSCGKTLPHTKTKICDLTTGEPLPAKQDGEICIKGPQVMLGYLNKPEVNKEVFDADGWLHTGDIGHIDEDGYLFVVDRLKELIKYKGNQVPPAVLEDVLLQHHAITDCAVIGIPDDEAGELPRAFVVVRPGQNVAEEEIQAYVAGKVAPYMKLRGGVEFVQEIPKNPAGKILRRKLKERLQSDINCNTKL